MEAAERSGAPGDAASHVRSPVVASRIIGRGQIAAARRMPPCVQSSSSFFKETRCEGRGPA
jgi:hypothetical protein